MNAPYPRLEPARPDVHEVTIKAPGAALKGQLFQPGFHPDRAVIIHAATGVPAGFYRRFASWLSEAESAAVLTYDYRGFGRSGSTRRATMVDWGLSDQNAALTWMTSQFPKAEIWVIGHSLGGLMLPFHDRADRVARLITVASGTVHSSDHPWSYRPKALAFWHLIGPALAGLTGRIPGQLLGSDQAIPAGVFWQWRRWCTTPGFYLGDVGRTLPVPDWSRMTGRAKFVAMADDVMVPPAATWRLMQNYPEAKKQQLVIRPRDFGLKSIGHISAFSARSAAIWPAMVA